MCLPDGRVYLCRPRGIFRKEGIRPLVGDDVEMTVTHEKDMEGSIDAILPRRNELIRPAAANIDQVIVVFAAADPKPVFDLLDRFLIYLQTKGLPVIIAFNKAELAEEEAKREILENYRGCGHEVLFLSVKEGTGTEEIRDSMAGKTTMLAGPSGVGKSSLTNCLCPEAHMETGEISRKIRRGKQTTRYTQIHRIGPDEFILDTPGFSSVFLPEMTQQELIGCYPEFEPYNDRCRFQGCAHISEPDCAVKEALAKGEIPKIRYENYVALHEELQSMKKY